MRDFVNRAAGRKENLQRPVQVVNSFDVPKLFFVALKGDKSSLYAETELKKQSIKKGLPPSTLKTLKAIRKTGTCTVTQNGATREILGENSHQYDRKLKSTFTPEIALEGRLVGKNGIFPADFIERKLYRLVGERNDLRYGKLLLFQSKIRAGKSHGEFAIAPERGNLVVSMRGYVKNGNLVESREIKDLTKVNGFWLPVEVEEKSFWISSDATKPDQTKVYRLSSHTVNDVTDEILKVELAEGDHEWVETTKATYKVGANGERIFQDENETNSFKKMWPGWVFTGSVSLLLAVTVAGYVRWKRLQLSKPV